MNEISAEELRLQSHQARLGKTFVLTAYAGDGYIAVRCSRAQASPEIVKLMKLGAKRVYIAGPDGRIVSYPDGTQVFP